MRFFHKQWAEWKAFLGDKDLHDMLSESYDEYCRQANVAQHWTGRSIVEEEEQVGEDSDEDEGGNHFVLPGDEDFEGDRPVAAGGGELNDEALVRKTKYVIPQELETYMDKGLYHKENGDTAGSYDDGAMRPNRPNQRPNKRTRISMSPGSARKENEDV